ncbi:MAG: tetratricopeptide repeat protein, partial [Myxococcota bacterium]
AAIAATTGGCTSSTAPADPPNDVGEVATPLRCAAPELTQPSRATTDGAIARQNLDAMIDGRRKLVEARPADLNPRVILVGLLLERTQYGGTFDDFDEAYVHADEAVTRHPEDGRSHLLLARVHTAVHEFDAALEALDAAGEVDGAADLRLTIQLARGEALDEVVDARRRAVDAAPSFRSHASLAAALAAVGQFEEADASYVAALEAYPDVSPLPFAWTAFQRGVMWAEMADEAERGCALYSEGVARLPSYVVATTHLSELESEGTLDAAIARMRGVVDETSDPEAPGFLGELLLIRNPDDAEAPDRIAAARARYDELLASYPLAFADHGAEFFMGPGADPERALELAVRNLDNRENDRAYAIAIEAALAANRPEMACTFAAAAGPNRANVGLAALVAEVTADCAR